MLYLARFRFTVETLTPLRLSDYQGGNYLRGALGKMMCRTYCAGDPRDPSQRSARAANRTNGNDGGFRRWHSYFILHPFFP